MIGEAIDIIWPVLSKIGRIVVTGVGLMTVGVIRIPLSYRDTRPQGSNRPVAPGLIVERATQVVQWPGGSDTPTYFTAIAAGLLLFLSPRMLPLVPAYLSYLGRRRLNIARR